jgi:hypothetical protein
MSDRIAKPISMTQLQMKLKQPTFKSLSQWRGFKLVKNGVTFSIATGLNNINFSDFFESYVGAIAAYMETRFTGNGTTYFGFSQAMSDDGNTLIVGTWDGVYVFTRDGVNWDETQSVESPVLSSDESFGYSVAISGDGGVLAIGAIGANKVYVFGKSTNNAFTLNYTINSPDVPVFGKSLALSSDGTLLAIGSYIGNTTDYPGVVQAGKVHLYSRFDTALTWQATLTADTPVDRNDFGASLSFNRDGTTLAVGDSVAEAVYVFTASGDNLWTQQQKLTANDVASNDLFGCTISLSANGNTLAIGAAGDDNSLGTDKGSIYIFTRSNTTWTQFTRLQAVLYCIERE